METYTQWKKKYLGKLISKPYWKQVQTSRDGVNHCQHQINMV